MFTLRVEGIMHGVWDGERVSGEGFADWSLSLVSGGSLLLDSVMA